VSSAPPLPEAFGNYALGDFVEVVSPQAISWLPQTTGWWWLGAVLLAVFAQYAWRRLRYWYRNRYRREATERLRQLGDTADQSTLVAELNRLLKLTTLAAFSREQVASLSGKECVDFLNGQCPTPPFSGEQGQLLAVGAYQAGTVAAASGQPLISACLIWVREHKNMYDV
jgi:hypothetical protein